MAADADLDLVSDLVGRAGYRKAGQVCTSVQRLLVDAWVIDDLAARLATRVASLHAGDPRDPDVQVGPMIAPAEAERAHGWIRQAVRRRDGAGRRGAQRAGAGPGAAARPAADSRS